MMEKTILSLDPSSTAIGWAEMGFQAELIDGGVIVPDDKRAGSFERIGQLCLDLRKNLDLIRPGTILIEWTLGKVGQRRHKGKGAGLAVYGAGVGAAAEVCRVWCQEQVFKGGPVELVPILENDWTRGVDKRDRQAAIAARYSQYPADLDPGADLADAIGMCLWWLRERKVRRCKVTKDVC